MQNFIVVASLVSELAGGQNDPPLVLNVTKKHFSPLRVKNMATGSNTSIIWKPVNNKYSNFPAAWSHNFHN